MQVISVCPGLPRGTAGLENNFLMGRLRLVRAYTSALLGKNKNGNKAALKSVYFSQAQAELKVKFSRFCVGSFWTVRI